MFLDFRERGREKIETERDTDRETERQRERERERNIDVREKHQLVASCKCPNWGSNLQPRYVP